MKYQPDPPPLNADPVLGNYLHRELQKLSGLFQADRTNNLIISDYIAGLLNDANAAEAQDTLDVRSTTEVTSEIGAAVAAGVANYLPLAGGTLTGLLTLNGQVKFPAVQVPSADVNTMDDWKQGTFTPAYALGTPGTSSFTYSAARYGRFLKMGSWVIATARLITDAFTLGTGSGSVFITGMPYPARTSTPAYHGGVTIQYSNGWTTQAPRGGYLSGSTVQLVHWNPANALVAQAAGNLVTGAVANNNDIIFGAFYETDD